MTAPTTAITTTVPATIPEPPATLPIADALTNDPEQFFADLEPNGLTQQEADELVQAVQNASEDVRQTFEASVDLYSGQFDDYVPTGSNVPVRTRRVIIAVATATMMPIARRSKI